MASPLKLSIGVTIDPAGAKSGGAAVRQEVAAIGGEVERATTKMQQLINTSAGLHSGAANNNARNWTGALAAEGLALDNLRAKYNPLFAVVRNYKTTVTELRTAHAMGALSSNEFSAALTRERQATLASIDALKGRNVAMRGGVQGFQTANIGAQFQDIVVTAGMGMDPLQIALQQGTQLSSVLGPMGAAGAVAGVKAGLLSLVSPVSLVTMGLIAAGVAAYQYFSSSSKEVKSLDDVLESHKKTIDRLAGAYGGVIDQARGLGRESRNLLGSVSRENINALQASRRSESNSFFDEVGDLTDGNIRGQGDVFADRKFAPFEESLKNLRSSVKAGTFDFEAFWSSVNRIGEANPEYRKLADTLILTSANAAEASKAFAEANRIAKELASNISPTGQLLSQGSIARRDMDNLARFQAREGVAARRRQLALDAEMASLNARSPAEKAAAARRNAALTVNDDEMPGERRDRIAADGKLALAEAEKALSDAQRDRLRSLDSSLESQRLDLSLIGQTVSESERLRMEYRLTAQVKEEAARNGVEVDQAELDLIRQKSAEYGKLAEQIAATNILRGQDEERLTLQTELSLVGQSEQVRARVLAQLQAEQDIRQRGLSLIGTEADMIRANARINADLTTTLERQRDAWGEIQSAGENTIDTLLDKLGSGDFAGALEDVAEDWQKTMLQLGVANPLKNAVLGTNLGTLSDTGGILGRLFGGSDAATSPLGQSVSAMTVSAGTVVINGGVSGASGLLSKITAANDNAANPTSLAQSRSAIGLIESGNNYSALGPLTKGDRAYGKYQVMGNNIPSWSQEALGKTLTPDQFLKDPSAQDAIFDRFFGKSMAKYGNPQDAASVWFTGRPQSRGANSADILGTTGSQYVDKFNSALGKLGETASGATQNLAGFGSGLGQLGQNLSSSFFPSAPTGGATAAGGGGLGGIFSKIFGNLFSSQYRLAAGGGIGLFANGGISDRPAIFGEGPMVEAAVPLPNGRSIPVDMRVRQVMPRNDAGAGTTAGGYNGPLVEFHNYGPPAEVEKKEVSDGRGGRREIYSLYDAVDKSVNDRGSPVGKTLERQYGVRKQGIARG